MSQSPGALGPTLARVGAAVYRSTMDIAAGL
jgi:hypothetical protein